MTTRPTCRLLSGAALIIVIFAGSVDAEARRDALSPANRDAATADCRAVRFVSVRGSGDTSSSYGELGVKISSALSRRAQAAGATYGAYGLPYTAVGISPWKMTNVQLPQYRLSVRHGRNLLYDHIKEQARDCENQRLILFGYSQGAQVVADVLSKELGRLTDAELDRVAAVVLVGDPRFNSREPFSSGSFRVGRNGVLGARTRGDLAAVKGRVRSWCRKDDIVCQGPGNPANHEQARYWRDYSDEISSFIAHAVGWASAADTSRWVLSEKGVRGLRLGRSLQAIRADSLIGALTGGCPLGGIREYLAPLRPPLKGVATFRGNSQIKLINLQLKAGVVTDHGISIGSRTSAVLRAYPNARMTLTPSPGTTSSMFASIIVSRGNDTELQFLLDRPNGRVKEIYVPGLRMCE